MHVAAAVGTPLIAIFGSTSPELTGPLSACLANSGTGVSPVSRPRTLERTGETPVPLERPRQDAKLVFGDKATILRQPVECSPCFLRECPIDFRCMNRITVEQVTAAVLQQL
jgi:ADP-heptose:LPS heptosyltransferase